MSHMRCRNLLAMTAAALLLFPVVAPSQTPEWVVFNTENSGLASDAVGSVTFDAQGVAWIGHSYPHYHSAAVEGGRGLSRFDGTDWTVFTTETSGMPQDHVLDVAFDSYGIRWAATSGGLMGYDGAEWMLYNSENSVLPEDSIWFVLVDPLDRVWTSGARTGLTLYDRGPEPDLWASFTPQNSGLLTRMVTYFSIDAEGALWIPSMQGGVTEFDGDSWHRYSAANSSMPNYAVATAVDSRGHVWAATWSDGVGEFDGETWTMYDPNNSDQPLLSSWALAVDSEDNVWIGSQNAPKGLVRFDGETWTVYNTGNSGLPDDHILCVTVDGEGNAWIGTRGGGLAVYREGGVRLPSPSTAVEGSRSASLPSAFSLSQNYPNPFNSSTTIQFSLQQQEDVGLDIYNLAGQKVTTLAQGQREVGTYALRWDGRDDEGRDLASGVYLYRLLAGGKAETRRPALVR